MINNQKRFLKLSTFILLAFCFFLTACNKDSDLQPLSDTNTQINSPNDSRSFARIQQDSSDVDGDGNEEELCFEIIFPVTVVFPDGGKEVANDEDGLIAILDTWYTANEDSEEDPTFEFPIQVVIDSMTQTINDEEALCELWDSCFEDEDDEEDYEDDEEDDDEEDEEDYELCFDILFPVELVLPDGSKQTIDSEQALWTAIEEWYEANEDSEDDFSFTYPIEASLDSTTVTINNDEELEELIEMCEHDPLEDCFTFNYPLSLIFPDSTQQTVNSEDELEAVLDEWYEANEDSEEEVLPVFPITITLTEDGSTQEINSIEELEQVFEDCYGDICPEDEGRIIMQQPGSTVTRAAIGMRGRGL